MLTTNRREITNPDEKKLNHNSVRNKAAHRKKNIPMNEKP